ncbi:MAG: hypothetical protein ABSA31_08640 [Acidimicrobiales bacterium]|jgi:hypothetical protein
MARRVSARWVVLTVALSLGLLGQVQPAEGVGTAWSVALRAGSGGEAASIAASPPSGVAAACVSSGGKTISVSWTAPNTHVSSYTVYQATSTTGTPGTYSSVATGQTGLSWTTGTLTTGRNYWYEVVSAYSSSWTSAKSAATGETTISSSSPQCRQP